MSKNYQNQSQTKGTKGGEIPQITIKNKKIGQTSCQLQNRNNQTFYLQNDGMHVHHKNLGRLQKNVKHPEQTRRVFHIPTCRREKLDLL